MESNKFTQRGWNSAYPEKVEVWNDIEEPAPSWITDICKVTGFDENNNPLVRYNGNSSGGREYYNPSGAVLFSTKKNDLICRDSKTGRILILGKEKFKLLYKDEKLVK